MIVRAILQLTVQIDGEVEKVGAGVAEVKATCRRLGKLTRIAERIIASPGDEPSTRPEVATTERAQDSGDGTPEGSQAAMERAGGVNDAAMHGPRAG